MEKKVLYKTKFGKPIVEGQKYSVVTKDNRVIQTVASTRTPEDESIVERFLTKTGADKFVKAQLVKPGPTRSAKEAAEDIIAKLPIFEQLEYICEKEEFVEWLKRNTLKVNSNSTGVFLLQGNTSRRLMSFTWNMRSNTMSCCGATEMNNHSGELDATAARSLTKERLIILAEYLVNDFNLACRMGAKNRGVVTYVRNPDNLSDLSARIGFLLAASDLFVKTGRFINPNSSNTLDVYAISDKWYVS